jgi:hypothetical protein
LLRRLLERSLGRRVGRLFGRRERVARAALQPLEVLLRVEQAVDVVDSQAVDAPLPDQFQHQAVCRLEHRRQLDPDAGQLVDLEEPAIIDLFRRHAPVRQAVVLRFQQLVYPQQALGVARSLVEPPQRMPYRLRQRRRALDQAFELLLEALRLRPARPQLPDRGRPVADVAEADDQVLQLDDRLIVRLPTAVVAQDHAQDPRVLPGRDRKAVLVVPHAEAAGLDVETQLQVPCFQHAAVVIA